MTHRPMKTNEPSLETLLAVFNDGDWLDPQWKDWLRKEVSALITSEKSALIDKIEKALPETMSILESNPIASSWWNIAIDEVTTILKQVKEEL